jgi:rfaE bifunctional protein nucleotidyltransferase chain/domain
LGKVVSQEEILLQRGKWDAGATRVVFVTGCFDLLHPGHVRLLEQARAHGNVLIAGAFSDNAAECGGSDSASPIKRPITPACERAEILASLAAVDFALEIDSTKLVDFLRRLRPDAIVDGAEPSGASSPLSAAAEAAGIDVIRIPLEPGHSSTRLIERITQLRA